MIEVKYLQDCEGADKYGSCSGCGKFSKEDTAMIKVEFWRDVGGNSRGTQICLCKQCRAELYSKI